MIINNKKELGMVGLILFSLIIPIDWLIMSFFGVFGGIVSIVAPIIMLIGCRLFSNAFDKRKWRTTIVLTTIVYIIVLALTWYTFFSLNAFKYLSQDYEFCPEIFKSRPTFLKCFLNLNDRFAEIGINEVKSLTMTLLIGLLFYFFFVFDYQKGIRNLARPFSPACEKSNKFLKKDISRIFLGFCITILFFVLSMFVLYLINTSEHFVGLEYYVTMIIPMFVFRGLTIIPGRINKFRTYVFFWTISVVISATAIVLTRVFLQHEGDEYTMFYPFYYAANRYVFSTRQGLLCAVLFTLAYPILDIVKMLLLLNIKKVFTIETIVAFCGKNIFEKKESDDSTIEIDSETKTSTEMEHK